VTGLPRRAVLRWMAACAAVAGARAIAAEPATPSLPDVAQIVARNASARGGLEGWRRVQTMAWEGHVEGAGPQRQKLSFVLEQKRPGFARFELNTSGQKSVRVFDGTHGWKLRPDASGQAEVQPYSDDELRFARGAQVIDGPLMDYAAKGSDITLAGMADADGGRAYVLDVRPPEGGHHRVWVDAESFLELRHEREFRNGQGQMARATVFYRNYRNIDGLMLPLAIETGDAPGAAQHRLVIDNVALNPVLDDRSFGKPTPPAAPRRGVVVDTRAAASAGAMRVAP